LRQGDEVLKIHESAENYLETILILSKKNDSVRSIDVATALGYSKPSVSVAMRNLRSHEYIETDESGYITLTQSGRKIAESMYERHTLISDWLIYLGVDKNTSLEDACKIEHVISEESFLAIKKHINSIMHSSLI
jgi:Mn-dependent DtxR family transcriptional regulator